MLNIRRKNKAIFGFTLIEVLLVIVIIGILATFATTMLFSARDRATDVRRISDIRQIQHALDIFAEENGGYPTDAEFTPGGSLVSRNGTEVYMQKIPQNPTPYIGGTCPDEYTYVQGSGGQSYTLTYCLAGKVSDLQAGECIARPGIICTQNVACACDDVAKNCCGSCAQGSLCDGGILFASGYSIPSGPNAGTYKLIYPYVDGSSYYFLGYSEWTGNLLYQSSLTGANDSYDGFYNQETVMKGLSINNFYNGQYCDNLNVNGSNDWYWPSVEEIKKYTTATDSPPPGSSLCSSPSYTQLYGYQIATVCYNTFAPSNELNATQVSQPIENGASQIRSKNNVLSYTICIRRISQ